MAQTTSERLRGRRRRERGRTGMPVRDGHALGQLSERVEQSISELPERIGQLSLHRLANSAAVSGDRMVSDLDHLGSVTLTRLGLADRPPVVNRVPRLAFPLGACVAALVGVLCWAAYQNTLGGDAWLTAPGAINAEIAAQEYTEGPSDVPTTPAAQASDGETSQALTVSSSGMGSASMGSASMGSASMGSASMGSASMGSASMGSASMGSASMGSASMGSASASSASVASTSTPGFQVHLVVNPPPLGGVRGPDGQVHDAFVPGTFTMKAGNTYRVTVVNYDPAYHTWSSPGLGVDATIPPASASGPSSTTFTIHATTAGTFSWHCNTPCDPWSMNHAGYMEGTVTVTPA